MKRDIDLFWSLKFYWINSNKGNKRNTWESNCLLVSCFTGCLSISLMFWNFFTLLLTISSWFLSKGTDFSFWLCQHKCGDEWSHSQVTPIKLSLHLGAECYPQGISSGWWQQSCCPVTSSAWRNQSCSCCAAQLLPSHTVCWALGMLSRPSLCWEQEQGNFISLLLSFPCSLKTLLFSSWERFLILQSGSQDLSILQCDFSFRGDLLGLTSSAPVRIRVLFRSNWH